MTKFWPVVTIILILGIGMIVVEAANSDGIKFTDLETECRYDTTSESNIGLENNRITFSGHFQTDSPEANMKYNFQMENSQIKLNIVPKNSILLDTFYDTCLASAVYEGHTQKLEPGDYTVSLYHDRERQEKSVIRIK